MDPQAQPALGCSAMPQMLCPWTTWFFATACAASGPLANWAHHNASGQMCKIGMRAVMPSDFCIVAVDFVEMRARLSSCLASNSKRSCTHFSLWPMKHAKFFWAFASYHCYGCPRCWPMRLNSHLIIIAYITIIIVIIELAILIVIAWINYIYIVVMSSKSLIHLFNYMSDKND